MPSRTADLDDLADQPLRVAEPEDLDPREVPFFSLWRRTDRDRDPLDSPVLRAYGAFVDEVHGCEDAFWTLLHWASGEAPTTAAVPAPPGRTRRVYVWREEELVAMTASPSDGIRPQFPPGMGVERRVDYLEWYTRMLRRLKETELGAGFESVADYRTADAWTELEERLEGRHDVGAVALFYTVEPRTDG